MYKLMTMMAMILCVASANALTYEWTDSAGVVHFTDSPENIPPAYLQHVIKKDDITIRDPKIREEIKRDEERARQEESASIPGQAVEPAPVPRTTAQTPPENRNPKPEVTPPEPVWNLCAPSRPLNIACAPGPLKKKGGWKMKGLTLRDKIDDITERTDQRAWAERNAMNRKISGNFKVLFVAGFGPVVQDIPGSHKFYLDTLGLSFEKEGDYLHTDTLKWVNHFALWPLSQAAQSCFGTESWPSDLPVPQAWLEFDVDNIDQATSELEERGYTLLTRAQEEPWGQIVTRLLSPEGLLVGVTVTPGMRE